MPKLSSDSLVVVKDKVITSYSWYYQPAVIEHIMDICSSVSKEFDAPEVEDGKTTYTSIVWSIGRVLLAMMATGKIMPELRKEATLTLPALDARYNR